MRGEVNIIFIHPGFKVRLVMKIQQLCIFFGQDIMAKVIENANKSIVALAVNFIQLYVNRLVLPEDKGIKKIRALIIQSQHFPLAITDDGRQLEQISYK